MWRLSDGWKYWIEKMDDDDAVDVARRALISRARNDQAEQEKRAQEFQKQVQAAFAKMKPEEIREQLNKLKPRDPVSLGWVLWYSRRYLFSTSLPGRSMPWLLFGDDYEKHPGYIPIHRRLEFTPGCEPFFKALIETYISGIRRGRVTEAHTRLGGME